MSNTPASGRSSSNDITPFELSLVAALLAGQNGDPGGAASCLDEAYQLLNYAAGFLADQNLDEEKLSFECCCEIPLAEGTLTIEQFNRCRKGFREHNTKIPFWCWLLEIPNQKGKHKRPRTLLGAINSESSLKKAIRRYMAAEAASILESRCLTVAQYDVLETARTKSKSLARKHLH